MLLDTKNLINSQKVEIAQFAYKKFGATFISILNNKNKYLDRNNYAYSHMRFTKVFDKVDGKLVYRDKKDYQDFYFYVTGSTTTDYESEIAQKLTENLSDRCFNVRKEVLFAHSNGKTFFLIDYGEYWAYCSQEYARKHVVKWGNYEGREVCTVRLAQGDFVKKEHEYVFGAEAIKFDATYLQYVTYSTYRKRGGFVKVEGYKNGVLQTIKYYVSTGEVKADFEAHGIKRSAEYFRILARDNKSIKVSNKEYKFSKVSSVSDSSSLNSSVSSPSNPLGLLGLSLQSYSKEKKENSNTCKNVMSNPTKLGDKTKVLKMENDLYITNVGGDTYSNNFRKDEDCTPQFTMDLL